MSQSLGKILLHVVYSTKNREPVLAESVRTDLYAYTVGILNTIHCVTLAINGTADHVHALVLMARTVTLAKMVEEMQRGSSRWLKMQNSNLREFSWQNGYGAFSVSESLCPKVVEYITGQEQHHQKMTFQDELRQLLAKHNIEFDERYVWG